jgi:cellulose synthase/poly-beta-1,6-N-acetylglucosamine synthase-like glycosyltransferase
MDLYIFSSPLFIASIIYIVIFFIAIIVYFSMRNENYIQGLLKNSKYMVNNKNTINVESKN